MHKNNCDKHSTLRSHVTYDRTILIVQFLCGEMLWWVKYFCYTMYVVVCKRHSMVCEIGIQNFECHGNGISYSYMMMDDDDEEEECEQWTTEVTHPANKERNYTGTICDLSCVTSLNYGDTLEYDMKRYQSGNANSKNTHVIHEKVAGRYRTQSD